LIKKTNKRHKLLREILGIVGICLLLSVGLYLFITVIGRGIIDRYCLYNGLSLDEFEYYRMDRILYGAGFALSAGCFIILFFAMFGDRLAYIRKITESIHVMQKGQKDTRVELVGNNELTELAEAVNYLSETEQKLKEKEKRLNEEREELIRTLSHDIRTPLTSIMSYTELFAAREDLTEEQREYLSLVSKKSLQIKELTDILLDGGKRETERFEDARLLFRQLAGEFEDELEEGFSLSITLAPTPAFSGSFDVGELQRIFDNLISNIRKYAEPEEPVTLTISKTDTGIVICQSNGIRKDRSQAESYRMGLNSIRRIAHNYGGTVEVTDEDGTFTINITLSDI